MFGILFSKKRKKRNLALEYISVFTFMVNSEIESGESFTADSKKALIYGLMFSGAIDAICQAFDQDDVIWANGIKFAIETLNFSESFAYYITTLHQKIDQNDECYKIVIEGGKIARKWMAEKLSPSSLLFEVYPHIEPFFNNDRIPNSIGEIIVKYKLVK